METCDWPRRQYQHVTPTVSQNAQIMSTQYNAPRNTHEYTTRQPHIPTTLKLVSICYKKISTKLHDSCHSLWPVASMLTNLTGVSKSPSLSSEHCNHCNLPPSQFKTDHNRQTDRP